MAAAIKRVSDWSQLTEQPLNGSTIPDSLYFIKLLFFFGHQV
jgi:hypothetical protein